MIDRIIKFFKPKYRYYKDWRDCSLYRKKKRVVKYIWIISLLLLLLLFTNQPHFIGITMFWGLLTTIVVFMFLDETHYPDD